MSAPAAPARLPAALAASPAHVPRRPSVAVARLPLPEALAACLELLDSDPGRFEPEAVTWHARLTRHSSRSGFVDLRLALDALAVLATPEWERGANALARVCARNGLDESAEVLERWRRERRRAGAGTRVASRALAGSRIG